MLLSLACVVASAALQGVLGRSSLQQLEIPQATDELFVRMTEIQNRIQGLQLLPDPERALDSALQAAGQSLGANEDAELAGAEAVSNAIRSNLEGMSHKKRQKIAPVSITPRQFVAYLKNTTAETWFFDYLSLVGHNAAPINSTKGINDVTAFFQAALTQEERDAIVAKTPKGVSFNNEFWRRVYDLHQKYLAIKVPMQQEFGNSEIVRDVHSRIMSYNEYVDWKKNMPFEVYDKTFEAENKLLDNSIRASRKQYYSKRDEWLNEKLATQREFYQPIYTASDGLVTQFQEIEDAEESLANELVFEDITNALTLWREYVDLKANVLTIGKLAADICRYNPACCEEPGLCRPTRITSPYS